MHTVPRLDHVVLLFPRESVLRGENPLELEAADGADDFRRGAEMAIDRRVVREEPDASLAGQ
jgi:hypothetical protein